MAGVSTTGIISLGIALVAGRNRVPSPAAGMTAFFTMVRDSPSRDDGLNHLGVQLPEFVHQFVELSRAFNRADDRAS
jgi:hypothetical protein